jgi:hypothetical protein
LPRSPNGSVYRPRTPEWRVNNGSVVNDDDIDNAVEELMVRGGRLNHKVQGFLPAESS